MNETAAAWAASIIVDDMGVHEIVSSHRSKEQALLHYKAKLELVGLKTLKKSQLLSLWNHLRDMQFVREGGVSHISKSSKKQAWIDHITTCLALNGSKDLKPITNAVGLPVAAAPVPNAASMPRSPFASLNPISNNVMQQLHQMNPFSPTFRNSASFSFPTSAAVGSVTAALPHMMLHNGNLHQQATNTSRKRKSPCGQSDRNEFSPPVDFADMMAKFIDGQNANSAAMGTGIPPRAFPTAAAAAAAAAPANNNGDEGRSPVELRILSELMQMGFEEKDKKECLDAIRRAVEKAEGGPPPTSDVVMLDIITQREEAEEARKMDEARKLSEAEKQQESERLRDKRKDYEERTLMNASLLELRDPPQNHYRLMFPESWLLRHEGCIKLLTEITEQKESAAKKTLIEILKLEKDSKKWYKAGDLPKFYFTFAIGKRLVAAHAKADSQALQSEMQNIVRDLQQGMYLPKYQTKENLPHIFLEAKEQYGSSDQAAGEDTGDDDDDDDDEIIVLNDEEIQQIRNQDSAGSRAALDTANLVLEMM